MKNQQGFIGLPILIAIVLGIVALGGGAYFVMQKQSVKQNEIATSNQKNNVENSVQNASTTSDVVSPNLGILDPNRQTFPCSYLSAYTCSDAEVTYYSRVVVSGSHADPIVNRSDAVVMRDADPKTFKGLSTSPVLAIDANHVFLKDKIVADADPATLQFVKPYDGNGFLFDKNHLFFLSAEHQVGAPVGENIETIKIVPNGDAKSLVVDVKDYAYDLKSNTAVLTAHDNNNDYTVRRAYTGCGGDYAGCTVYSRLIITKKQTISTENSEQTKTYTSADNTFSFNYPANLTVKPTRGVDVSSNNGTSTLQLPNGSIEIPGVLVLSKISLSEISKEKPFLTYESCCSGKNYWFNIEDNTWNAERFHSETTATSTIQIVEPFSLQEHEDSCTISLHIGGHVYYKLKSWDEGMQTLYYYYLPTSDLKAIQIISYFDMSTDYSGYPKDVQPNLSWKLNMEKILSSIMLKYSSELKPTCL